MSLTLSLLEDKWKGRMVYLAAPYTDPDKNIVEERMKKFYAVDARLSSAGIFTVSPLYKHAVVKNHKIDGTWGFWENYSKVLLRHCDAMIVIMMEGWQESVGVQAEIDIAERNNIAVYYVNHEDIIGE